MTPAPKVRESPLLRNLRCPLTRPEQKIVHQRYFANLGVERLHVNRRLSLLAPRPTAKYTCSPFQKLTKPLRDLIRVNVKLLRQFRQRLFALNGDQCHLCLECRAVVPAGSFAHL